MADTAGPPHAEMYDAVIIGGGPAGSTLGNLLAAAGRRVVILEKESFPRYHIGESLLPGSIRIFERLGVHDAVRASSVHKPGGKWHFETGPVYGRFDQSDWKSTFKKTPYAYMVERATFDSLLLDQARARGAEVRLRHTVTDLLWESDDAPQPGTAGDPESTREAGSTHETTPTGAVKVPSSRRLRGVRVRDAEGQESEVYGRMVFDCSGLRAVVANRLRLREPNSLHRMGIYAQYRATARDADLAAGWFVGRLIPDGWLWLIPLGAERISVGAVVHVDHFKDSATTPETFLDEMVRTHPFMRESLEPGPARLDPVRVTGQMGGRSRQFAGPGWVLVGDAAFFIDPCYSSGVHVALLSAEKAADRYLQCLAKGDLSPKPWKRYTRELGRHEHHVMKMVEGFYVATRNPAVQRAVVRMQTPFFQRRFTTFVGGDFTKNTYYVAGLHRLCLWIDGLFPKQRVTHSRARAGMPDS